MHKINDGGAAFPIPHSDKPGAYAAEPGMSLRDWFAAVVDKDEYGDPLYRHASRAMRELLAGPYPEEPKDARDRPAWQLAALEWEFRFRAEIRFRMADAMLAARSAGEKEMGR